MEGTRLGPYEIVERIGAGGMGEVWRATDTRLGRKVAVKVLPEQFAGDPERLARFEQEARAAAALNHPHIATVHDVGHEGDVHFMVQELLDGRSLRDALADGPLPLDSARKIATEIAEALVAAHAAGIVHRDLKPDNVFVTASGHAKVLDFGLAKLTEPGAIPSGGSVTMSPTLLGTQAGAIMGTAGYMAPEQVEGGEVDARADLFAFGCVLYEMLTGKGPFQGESVYDTLHRIGHKEPEPLQAKRGDAPVPLLWIVRKCLAKKADLRYQDAADLLVDLRSIESAAELLPALPEAGAAVAIDPEVMGPRRGPSLRTVVPAVLVLLLLGALAGWLARAPVPTVVPPVTFDFEFPEEHPTVVPCCAPNVALAADASFLVLAGRPATEFVGQLYLRRLGDLDLSPIAGAQGYMPTVSPDGLWVAYFAAPNVALKKVALAGGAPFDLGVTDAAAPFWADDGYIYLGAGFGGGPLRRVPENGGEVETIEATGIPEDASISRLFVLPGGRTALVEIGSASLSSIGALDLTTLEVTMLAEEGATPQWAPSGHALWSRDDVVYAAPFDADARVLTGPAVPVLQGVASGFLRDSQFAIADDGTVAWIPGESSAFDLRTSTLSWLDGTGAATAIADRTEGFSAPRLSPDGRRIAVLVREIEDGTRRSVSTDIWVMDVAQGTLARLTSAGDASDPVWSPDGEWIYYARGTRPEHDIWRRRSDFSAPPEAVDEREGAHWPSDVTPDGEALIVEARGYEGESSESSFNDDLWLLPLGDGEPVPLLASEYDEFAGRVSPDGRLLAFTSTESGQRQIYVRELAGQRRWPISPGVGFTPFWGREGLRLYYSAGVDLSVVDLSFDGDTLEQTAPRVLFTRANAQSPPYDVTADGRFLSLSRGDNPLANPTTTRDRVRVRLNWFQELERLAPPRR